MKCAGAVCCCICGAEGFEGAAEDGFVCCTGKGGRAEAIGLTPTGLATV